MMQYLPNETGDSTTGVLTKLPSWERYPLFHGVMLRRVNWPLGMYLD